MLITTACERCLTSFAAGSFAARYCSRRCQQAAYRARKKAEAEGAEASRETVTDDRPPAVSGGEVAAATRAELRTIGRERSAVGLAALALARRIDQGDDDSAGGLAAIVREHARALDRALMTPGGTQPTRPTSDDDRNDDPVATLQEARERRRRRVAAQR